MWGATGGQLVTGTLKHFQSTLPVWGATDENNQRIITAAFQSTLPVWGATAEILNKSPAKRDKEQE